MSAARTYLPAGMPRPVPEPDGLDRRTGRARGAESCGSSAAAPAAAGSGARSGSAIAVSPSISTGSGGRPRGRIYSWERAWHPVHPALTDHGPYIVVLVELPDAGGVRMLGNLLGDPRQAVQIGAPVEAVFEPHDEAAPPFTLVQWRMTP